MDKKTNDYTTTLYRYSGPLRKYRLKRRCSFFDLASELGLPLKALTDIEQRNVLNEEPKILKQWVQQLESVLGPSVPLTSPVPAYLRGGAK